jgi:DNA-binding transcriptional LysR family regulator
MGGTQVDLNQLFLFVRVVQAGGFSAAARQLAVPKSTLSRKVAELEERLGARLLQRTTRKLGLTDAGRIYYEHATRVVAEAQEAEQAVGHMQAAPRGLLRVTAPLSFAILLGPIVSEYLKQHGDVQVDLVCTDRNVHLVEEGFDVAIRAGALADSSLVARSLGALKRVIVAAPDYCKQRGTPQAPADLEKHACITFGAGATPNVWALKSGGKRTDIRISPRLVVNDLEIMRAAALDGIGIAWIAGFVCVEDIRKRRLRHVLPGWGSEETPLHAVYPTARHLSPKVAAFIELVGARLRL